MSSSVAVASTVAKLTAVPKAISGLWKRCWRKVYKPLGFPKGSEFFLFAIFGGSLLFFSLQSMKLIGDNTPAGGIFYFSTGYNKIGNKLHLIGLIFGCFFGFYQFIPVIKQKAPMVDRIIGFLATILYLISQAGLLMNLPKAGGGDLSAVVALALVTITSTTSLFVAYYNLVKGKAQAFREWRIRAWGWAGSVITLRFLIFGVTMLMHLMPNGPWYTLQSCSVIYNTYTALGLVGEKNPTSLIFPSCAGPQPTGLVAVKASMTSPEGMATVYNFGFAIVTWLSFVLHSAVLELYFRKTATREVLPPVSAGSSIKAGVVEKRDGVTTVTEVASDSA